MSLNDLPGTNRRLLSIEPDPVRYRADKGIYIQNPLVCMTLGCSLASFSFFLYFFNAFRKLRTVNCKVNEYCEKTPSPSLFTKTFFLRKVDILSHSFLCSLYLM